MTEDEASVTNSETLADFEIDSSDLLRAPVSIRVEDKDVIRLSMISACKIWHVLFAGPQDPKTPNPKTLDPRPQDPRRQDPGM